MRAISVETFTDVCVGQAAVFVGSLQQAATDLAIHSVTGSDPEQKFVKLAVADQLETYD